ncbi:TadE/TadG family type IV pilus assembly protein [uncultured Acidaminococcus sp.]|uniref:TadE/TadG family type IV pilus assembly protein n=1 Tax=uncultured Acidaminococcus sp. TaxID=352152 RepID=UPI0026DB277B|nr:TadE/TadG family type IV pilus assembly protein [uncultured Acidaminococcus sp.]
MKRQKGQDIVEFAILVPLFFLILIAMCAFGMFFSDYITFNNVARSVAREAVVREPGDNWDNVKIRNFNEYKTAGNLYKLTNENNITIEQTTVDGSPSVTVTVQAPMKTQGAFFSNLGWAGLLQGSDLKTMRATYTMYDENQQK